MGEPKIIDITMDEFYEQFGHWHDKCGESWMDIVIDYEIGEGRIYNFTDQ